MEENFLNQETVVRQQWDERYDKEQVYRKMKIGPHAEVFFNKYGEELKEGKVLDIGCGNGRLLRYLLKSGYDATGLDISSESLEQLKKDFTEEGLSADIQQGSIYNLPYKDASFKSALCINVFQHNDWQGALRSFAEVGRVLEEDGIFYFMARSSDYEVPAGSEIIKDRGITFIPSEGSKAGIKIHHFSKDELLELAGQNSMEVIDEKFIEPKKLKVAGSDGSQTKSWWIMVFRKNKIESK